jgi:hypothetical protein
LYYSATASSVPVNTNLTAGELAINTNDGKLFYKDSSNVVQTLASKAAASGTFPQVTIGSTQLGAGNSSAFKNRIINGAMVIDQRNAGASVTIGATASTYTLDRFYAQSINASKFSVQQNAGSVTSAIGFVNYLGCTSLAATSSAAGDYYALLQNIEGFNIADLGWGTANAKTVTLSFQVYSSLTGTFGGSLRNSANNRSYPFSYSIPTANTWTTISVTVAGDTSGTWITNNGSGIILAFNLGCGSTFLGTANSWQAGNFYAPTGATSVVGTNTATFYITGVQLEVGSYATGFDYRPYGTELALCQRYCRTYGDGLSGIASVSTIIVFNLPFEQPMRSSPTLTITDNSILVSDQYTADFTSTGSTIPASNVSTIGGRISINGYTGLTVGRYYVAYSNTNGSFVLLSSEL